MLQEPVSFTEITQAIGNVLHVGFEISFIGVFIFVVKMAFAAGKTKTAIMNWCDSVKNNHLAHIQSGIEKLVDGSSELIVAMKLHDQNENSHHAEQLRTLHDIKSDGCDKRCKH